MQIATTVKKIREGDIKDHNKSLWSYKLFQWRNDVKNFLLSFKMKPFPPSHYRFFNAHKEILLGCAGIAYCNLIRLTLFNKGVLRTKYLHYSNDWWAITPLEIP